MKLRHRIREWLGINALTNVVCLYRDAISAAEAEQRTRIDALAEHIESLDAFMGRTAEIMNTAFEVIEASERFYDQLTQRQRVPQEELDALRDALADWQKSGMLQ